MRKDCIECDIRPANYWNHYFCEECFRKLLREKLDKEDKKLVDNEKSI